MKYLYIIFLSSCLSLFSQETVENNTLDTEYTASLKAVKKRVKESIDAYAYHEDSTKKSYKVAFEGNHIRLRIENPEGEIRHKGFLFDISKVSKFDPISFRRKDRAYINVRTMFLDKEKYKRKKFVQIKLIMKVLGHENATIVMQALKDYNEILNRKR